MTNRESLFRILNQEKVKHISENGTIRYLYKGIELNEKEGKLISSDQDQDQETSIEFPLETGSMLLDFGDPVNFLYINSDLNIYAFWTLTPKMKVKIILDNAMEQRRLSYKLRLEKNLADIYFIVGRELAVPPIDNHTFSQVFKVTKDQITLIGNIQFDDFLSCSEEQLRQAVQIIIDECKTHLLIFSPSASPYISPLTTKMEQNYLTFIDEAVKYGIKTWSHK